MLLCVYYEYLLLGHDLRRGRGPLEGEDREAPEPEVQASIWDITDSTGEIAPYRHIPGTNSTG